MESIFGYIATAFASIYEHDKELNFNSQNAIRSHLDEEAQDSLANRNSAWHQ